MFDYRAGLLAFFVAVSGCGETFTATGGTGSGTGEEHTTGVTSTGTGATTSTMTPSMGGATTSGVTTTTSGPGGTGGSSGSGGAAGGPVGFSTTCAGTVDCPGAPACADWEYTINDDGVTTVVDASVTLLSPGMTCSDQTQYASSIDTGVQVAGNIMFPCDTQEWMLGIDKSTSLVYVKELTMGYSWTPPCK